MKRVINNVKQDIKQNAILYSIVLAIIAVIIFVVVVKEIKLHESEQRCTSQGGTTWDQGRHCILPDFTVIDTS